MTQSLRNRYYMAILSWPACFVVVAALVMLTQRHELFLLLIPFLIFINWYAMRLKCPNCQTGIGRNSWGFWTPWVPRKCRHCQHDLD